MTMIRPLVVTLSIVCVGLMAGLYSAFAYAVMPALSRVEPCTAVAVMQRINVVIVNPLFLLIFFGGVVFSAAAALLCRRDGLMWWLVGGAALYLASVVVTIAGNIPRNNALLEAGDPVALADPGAVWNTFVGPWVVWNIIRAVLATAALIVMVAGLLGERHGL